MGGGAQGGAGEGEEEGITKREGARERDSIDSGRKRVGEGGEER